MKTCSMDVRHWTARRQQPKRAVSLATTTAAVWMMSLVWLGQHFAQGQTVTTPAPSPAPVPISPFKTGSPAPVAPSAPPVAPTAAPSALAAPSVAPASTTPGTLVPTPVQTPSSTSGATTSLPSSVPTTLAPAPAVPGTLAPSPTPPAVAGTPVPSSAPQVATTTPGTSVPSSVPGTPAPSKAATSAPTGTPPVATASPTPMPVSTAAPTPAPLPTAAPTPAATTARPTTLAPVTPPTVSPTSKPTEAPSAATPVPTQTTDAPTLMPTVRTGDPTRLSTPKPTRLPTRSPTREPTPRPTTGKPTKKPTPRPTVYNATSLEPTLTPTLPSQMPSEEPSSAPSAPAIEAPLYQNLVMTLYGVGELSGSQRGVWQTTTEKYIKDYFIYRKGLKVTISSIILTITSQSTGRRQRQLTSSLFPRNLQSSTSVTLTYQQEFSYHTTDPSISTEAIVQYPFSKVDDRDQYVKNLLDTNAFTGLTATSTVTSGSSGSDNNNEGGTGSLSQTAWIAIFVGGGVLILAVVMGTLFYLSSQRGRRRRKGYISSKNQEDAPPTQLQLGIGPDEVSTLAEPLPKMGRGTSGQESIAGYGDQSVTTVDYDYSKAYGGGGDTSVSSAGGTFGSNTKGDAVEVTASAVAAGAALGGSFSDSDSFDAQYRDPTANIKEELIDIYAPPGKLGVVIDTPDDGAPVVHAVKDSSVIADKLQVGDKLVAVDDEDVRAMTAIKVSKLISRKSSNPTRKLSILRTTIIE